MNEFKPKELALAYLASYRGLPEPDDAYSNVLEVCSNFERGMDVTLALIDEARTGMELAYVAAGPLEDMIKWHGLRTIPALESACKKSEKVGEALADIYLSNEHEAYSEWNRLIQTYKPLKTRKNAL